MDENFRGNVRGFYTKPIIPEPPTERKEFQPLPTQHTPIESKDNFKGGFVLGFIVLAISIGLVIGGIFVWQVSDGMFKSSNTQSVNLEPQIDVNVTSNTENTFQNTFNNAFENNFTLIVNLDLGNANLSISS